MSEMKYKIILNLNWSNSTILCSVGNPVRMRTTEMRILDTVRCDGKLKVKFVVTGGRAGQGTERYIVIL